MPHRSPGGSERRKQPRTKPYAVLTEAERETLKALLHSVFDERGPQAREWFGDLKPEEHIEAHRYVSARMKFSAWLHTTFMEGVGGGIGLVLKIIVAALGVTALISIFGTLMSDSFRGWLLHLLGGA